MYAKYEAKHVKPEIINQKSKDDQHMVMVPKCNIIFRHEDTSLNGRSKP